MSWWDTGNADDVTGDQPADAVADALKEVAASRDGREQPRPALQELLAGIGIVTQEHGKEFEAAPTKVSSVIAELDSGDKVETQSVSRNAAGEDVVTRLEATLKEVVDLYQSRWERNPRVTEWLAAFEFILGSRPGDFLDDGEGREVRAIRIQ